MNFVIPIEEGILYKAKDIGSKAFFLSMLTNKGFFVPRGYIVRKEAFDEFARLNKLKLKCSDNNIYKYYDIKEEIYAASFEALLYSELEAIFKGLNKPIIVRSSAAIEDGALTSCAGLFKSVSDIYSFREFLEAIKICWISGFSDLLDVVVGSDRDKGISLVVQEQIISELGGVAFTQDPIDNSLDKIIIEAGSKGSNGVVTGSGEVARYIINKTAIKEAALEPKIIMELAYNVKQIELLIGRPVDVEWLYSKEVLYFVQARPITHFISEKKDTIISVDDPEAYKYDLENYTRTHSKWLEKKIPIRKLCRENNIKITDYYYFKIGQAHKQDIEKLKAMFSYDMLEINDGKRRIKTNKNNFLRVLEENYQNVPVVRINDMVPTYFCGYSTVIDNYVYIEAIPGGFKGYGEEGILPSIYILDKKGELVREDIKQCDKYFSCISDTWIENPSSDREINLSGEILKKIHSITILFYQKLGEVRLEWMSNEDVYLKDLTIEKTKITGALKQDLVLSLGKAEGYAKLINNFEITDEKEKTLSVRMGYRFSKLNNSEYVKKLKETLKLNDKDAILVSEYPNESLAIFTDCVKGFIFDRGSLLCHLAIILREKGIPAAVIPEATRKIKDGQKVIINGSEIIVK